MGDLFIITKRHESFPGFHPRGEETNPIGRKRKKEKKKLAPLEGKEEKLFSEYIPQFILVQCISYYYCYYYHCYHLH